MQCDTEYCHREATHRANSQGCDLGVFCSSHVEYEASNWRLEEEEEEEEATGPLFRQYLKNQEAETTPNGESR